MSEQSAPAPESDVVREPSIGVVEAAAYLDVPRSWLYAKVESPDCDVPYFKMGRYLKFLVSELNAYRHQNQGGPKR